MQTPNQAQEASRPDLPDAPADPQSEPLLSVTTTQDDDPEEIFLKAVAEIETQPLPQLQEVCWPFVILTLTFFLSFVGGSIIGLITYPTVTIDVAPVTKQVAFTTQLSIATRVLAPVTLAKSDTVPTTAKGHQDARAASGILTFYNGQAIAQTIPIGSVLTGADGSKVATNQAITIPPGNPPTYGQTSVTAHALVPGSAGNLAAGDINTTIALAVFVKNGTFVGGQNQRDYRAVAQSDQDRLTVRLRIMLAQAIPQAFPLAVGEQAFPTDCAFKMSPNHRVGAEANTLTVTATETCKGVAYNTEQLTQRATTLFTARTVPGVQYRLVGSVQVHVVSATPLTVFCRGLWVYVLSQDYEQFLAGKIAGKTPQEARKYLLETGLLTRVTIPEKLPQDPAHIRFRIFVGI